MCVCALRRVPHLKRLKENVSKVKTIYRLHYVKPVEKKRTNLILWNFHTHPGATVYLLILNISIFLSFSGFLSPFSIHLYVV